MHDGFGSQLASVRLMVEKGRITPEQLPAYLQEVSADLHLVVDTLSPTGITLEEALHDMRYRMERRFAGAGPQLAWQMALASMPALSSRTILQILRILQEALHNAIRHAQAQHIVLRAVYTPAQRRLLLSVEDDGRGLSETLRPGRGLSNMRHRAREVGGTLAITATQPGTCVSLEMTIPDEGPVGT